MIRLSTPRDIPSIITLAEDSGLFPPDHLDSLREMLGEYFETKDDQERFWLVADDGGIVGVVFCEPEMMTFGTWNLRLIAVAPALQGTGRGGQLLSHLEEYLQTKEARLLIVDTSGTEDFAPVRKFYRKNGYTEESTIRDFFEPGDDKVTFTKNLK